ncbi:hypothetical protein [Streptomyces atacamensis]|uniref:hypothetical protein n=1 Tax=Streptomyces atacamensis TaxID=531966 RepID=UPI00399C6E23
MLLICSCALVSGARTIEERPSGASAPPPVCLRGWGCAATCPAATVPPSHPALTRILAAVDGDALDTAVGAYLAQHDRGDVQAAAAPGRATAVDGKRDLPEHAAWIMGVTDSPHPSRT